MSQQKQQEASKPKGAQRYINGALSGFVEVSLTHWIDVLKTRLQAEKETTKGINVRNLSARIYKEEGVRGFYRGFISRCFGIGPMRATFWGVMDEVLWFDTIRKNVLVPSRLPGLDPAQRIFWQLFPIASVTAMTLHTQKVAIELTISDPH
jgi:hypothetical protein